VPSNGLPPLRKEEGTLHLTVELTGLGRSIAGERATELTLPLGTDFHGVIRCLAGLYPGLVGVVIAPGGEELLNANIISRNGEDLIMPDRLDGCPQDGDRLTLISIIVGG
jgi:hypothetical protein